MTTITSARNIIMNFMARILSVLVFSGWAASANATLIDFESGLDSAFTYSGVTSGGSVTAGSGYDSVLNATSSNGLVFNPGAISPSSFSWNSSGTFDLTSFIIAGAWGNQTLTFEGLNSGSLLFSTPFSVTPTAVSFVANWVGIDQLRILIDPNGYTHTVSNGSGQHWALDNLLINENSSQVPVPATLALFGLGLAGLGWSRRKKS